MATVVTQTPPTTARAKHSFAKALTITSSILATLVGLGWTGLQIQPTPFPAVGQPSAPLETIPLMNHGRSGSGSFEHTCRNCYQIAMIMLALLSYSRGLARV